MTTGEYPDKVPPQRLIPPRVFDSDYDIKRFMDVSSGADLIYTAGPAAAFWRILTTTDSWI